VLKLNDENLEMNSNGRNNYLKITDTVIALVILVVVIIGGILIYKAFTKDDRYVRLLDHRNGILIFETMDDKLYRMDESDSLVNAIKHYSILENSEEMTFYFVNSTLPKERVDSILDGHFPANFQVDLMLEFKREGSSMKLKSSKITRNTTQTKNEFFLLQITN
jgi:hypothetical protein